MKTTTETLKTGIDSGFLGDAYELIERWKRGEDVQDALAHKLRTFAKGCDTLMRVSNEQSDVIKALTGKKDRLLELLERVYEGTVGYIERPGGPAILCIDKDLWARIETELGHREEDR